MRVAVVGAGIVGVTSAYELAVDGHEVTVFERGPGVAGGASFANAGLIAPGYLASWAATGLPGRRPGQGFGGDASWRLGSLAALGLAPWMWRWWRAGRSAEQPAHRARLQRLAQYSHERLDGLTRDLPLDHERSAGYTVLLRDERDLKRARGGIKLLSELGVPFELLDAARARRVEPGLHEGTPLRAAIHLPRDGVGNCRQFAHLLKAEAQRLGAQFQFQQVVRAIRPGTPAILALDAGEQAFDAVVLCAGPQAGELLAPIGLRLPLAPVWGYSLTAPLRQRDDHAEVGPRSAILDERHQIVITRLGQRVRVAGGAELGGQAQHFHPGAMATLYKVLDDWFPGAALMAQAQRWKGARPTLPDGPPVLGASGRPGVWLNLGHGASGWALAAGSARVLADLLAGRAPALDTEGLGIERLA